MDHTKSFAERRRQLQSQAAAVEGAVTPPQGEAMDDWNNFPNYFKFASFANTSVPQPKHEPESPK
ncbi:hypothetical protein QTI66_10780 [Variovorax sp. J22R133]|uniref:hypothetical protein n=1 Tax=Variovorax brevis TaxID=3053503 RepID=UPI0025764908|nr:hypothetical protein [Variovorax sp. J22R133]MDM0112634.1 hypothetical protein [Variovorax sp. J22R133]